MSTDFKNGLSRRQFLSAGIGGGIAAAVGVSPTSSAVQQRAAGTVEDLVLINGRIHTMDGNNTIAQSVSIRNGRFLTVGGATPRRGPGVRTIDLKGRTAIPGIIDNHNHIVLLGNRPGYHTPLENAFSIHDVQETFATRAKGIPPGAWITTIGGFHRNHLVPPNQMPRLPTLAELDEAVPNYPVYISEGFTGPSTTNSLGKKFFESQNPPIPVGADGSKIGRAHV